MTSRIGLVRLLHYDRRSLRGDLIGGATVTAYLIPQVMAYSSLAGLPPHIGLTVIVVTMVIYALVGSSSLLSVGPESTTALMTAAVLAPLAAGDAGLYVTLATVLALFVAAYSFLSWIFRLGFIGDLLSKPVLTGYMAGVAVIMMASQLGKVTGVDVAGDTFTETIRSFVDNVSWDAISWWSVAIGVTVAVSLIVLTPRFPRFPTPIAVVLGATAVVYFLGLTDYGVETVGDIEFTTVSLGLPRIDGGMLSLLALPALGIFVVGYTDNILSARMFGERHRERVHNNQEFLALGAANVGSSLVGGFPVSSSASRAVIAEASGARSQLYSIVAAALVVVSVLVFSSVIEAFPAPALGGLVVYAAIRLIDVREFRRIWRFRRREFLLAAAALAGVLLFDILYGVLAAVAISVVELLTRVARPHSAVLGQSPGVAGWHDVDDYSRSQQLPGLVVFRYDSPLFFANAEHFAKECEAAIRDAAQPVRWFLLNMEGNTEVDITGLDALDQVRRECESDGIIVALVRVKRELLEALVKHGVGERIGLDRIYPTLPTAVEAYETWAAANR